MSGFPPELRPLLAIVIVLAIVHMLLKARSRSAKARTRRRGPRTRPHSRQYQMAAGTDGASSLAATKGAEASIAASVGAEPTAGADPVEALCRLRQYAIDASARSKDPIS